MATDTPPGNDSISSWRPGTGHTPVSCSHLVPIDGADGEEPNNHAAVPSTAA